MQELSIYDKYIGEKSIQAKKEDLLYHLEMQGIKESDIVSTKLWFFHHIQNDLYHPLWRVLQATQVESNEGFLTPRTNKSTPPDIIVSDFVQELIELLKIIHVEIQERDKRIKAINTRIDFLQKQQPSFLDRDDVLYLENGSSTPLNYKFGSFSGQLVQGEEEGVPLNVVTDLEQPMRLFNEDTTKEVRLVEVLGVAESLSWECMRGWVKEEGVEVRVEVRLSSGSYACVAQRLLGVYRASVEELERGVEERVRYLKEAMVPFKEAEDCEYIRGVGFRVLGSKEKARKQCCPLF